MFKAVIETHNLKQISPEPVSKEEITKPTLMELLTKVLYATYSWEDSEHSGTSLTISISEV